MNARDRRALEVTASRVERDVSRAYGLLGDGERDAAVEVAEAFREIARGERQERPPR